MMAPLYYENSIPELQLTNKELNEDLQRFIDETELDPDQENKLEREFAREYHLITRDDRLESQNEIEDFKKKGLDIVKHRKRIVKEDLDKKFKDPDDPFRIVFVCAMWMTGFDVTKAGDYGDHGVLHRTTSQRYRQLMVLSASS